MTETTAFLMKDLVLLAVSFYLLRQDVVRVLSKQLSPQHQQEVLSSGAPRTI
jgi:hypothetical protein